MFEKRTDLALEVHEIFTERGVADGITVEEREKDGVKITAAHISEGAGEQTSGKKAGVYITVDVGQIWHYDSERFNAIARVLSEEIKMLLPETVSQSGALIAGLGNEYITPDSIGPKTVSKMVVTRHLKQLNPKLYKDAGFGCVAAICPGVLGQTGVESFEIIKSVTERIKPACVIIIDALASRRLSRLATTVQLSDNGIRPGSGVSNLRSELSEELLGAPVISIGVPTVVDAATLAHDLLEEHSGAVDDPKYEEIIERLLTGSGRSMFITPKDSDIISRETARMLACALNLALHKIDISEMNEYVS